jgi:hypothetical protein
MALMVCPNKEKEQSPRAKDKKSLCLCERRHMYIKEEFSKVDEK